MWPTSAQHALAVALRTKCTETGALYGYPVSRNLAQPTTIRTLQAAGFGVKPIVWAANGSAVLFGTETSVSCMYTVYDYYCVMV